MNNQNEVKGKIFFDYYREPFHKFEIELKKRGYSIHNPHKIRSDFWKSVPKGEYFQVIGQELIKLYLDKITDVLSKEISQHSIMYWIHLYRRIFPGPIGADNQEVTIGLTRAALEAAIQKYGKGVFCLRIGISNEVGIENILNGYYNKDKYKEICEYLLSKPQMVLTDFGVNELMQLYEIEKLGYELWRSGAHSRSLGKGARLIVNHDCSEVVEEVRDDHLETLIKIYDSRLKRYSGFGVTSTRRGTLTIDKDRDEGIILLPVYNVAHLDCTDEFKQMFNVEVPTYFKPNFFWDQYNLLDFYRSNEYYSESFFKYYSIELKNVIAIIYSLMFRVIIEWKQNDFNFIHYWQRAYDGPHFKENIIEFLIKFFPHAQKSLHLDNKIITEDEIRNSFNFWELTESGREKISIQYHNFHKIILPVDKDRIIIDYAWLHKIFYELFGEISPINENFKGDALEQLIRDRECVLPIGRCKSTDKESRQIDASFSVDDKLLIIECRAIGKDLGFEKGSLISIQNRKQRLTQSLRDIDEKANWLIEKKKGVNFDTLNYSSIIPIVVTPFVEYIHSHERYYWLTCGIPRIITPMELKEFLDDGLFKKNDIFNIPII